MAHVIGQYIVTDPKICHGKPTFRGTRIMVHQVLKMVAKEMERDAIVRQCHGNITKEAIAEAVTLARLVEDTSSPQSPTASFP